MIYIGLMSTVALKLELVPIDDAIRKSHGDLGLKVLEIPDDC